MILLIEDSPTVGTMTMALLSRRFVDVTVHWERSFTGGVKAYDAGTYDLVITDGELGDGTGAEVAAHVNGATPVILCSGNDTMVKLASRDTVLFRGAVVKGDPRQLLDLVEEVSRG